MFLIDSNVLIDIFTRSATWEWSLARLEETAQIGPLSINDVIYAEISIRFAEQSKLDAVLAEMGLNVSPLSRRTAFVAGKAFALYRAAGGARDRVLPDFLIGAHAQVQGLTLLTRDSQRYRRYFPDVRLITPDRSA